MKEENRSDNGIFGEGVGHMTTVGELKSNELDEGYKMVMVNPKEFDFSDLPIKQHCSRINPLSIRGNEDFKTKSSEKLKWVSKWNKIKQNVKSIIAYFKYKPNKIDKSTGYYSRKYRLLSGILRRHDSWLNNCSEKENIEAKKAIILFYYEYMKCKTDKRYCYRNEMGHYSYLIYLIQIRQALADGLYQRACNELHSLLHYDYFLQKRIKNNVLKAIEEFLESKIENCKKAVNHKSEFCKMDKNGLDDTSDTESLLKSITAQWLQTSIVTDLCKNAGNIPDGVYIGRAETDSPVIIIDYIKDDKKYNMPIETLGEGRAVRIIKNEFK